MTGSGAGPSRRSHTKSRKGCKTCKRRHIRCDETYPQCRNCTKHQVRCDYMETAGSDIESQQSPEQQSLQLSPGSESRVEQWQQSGRFPYPEMQVFPHPHAHEYSRNDLRLIHHLSTIANNLTLKGASHLTTWTQKVPKFLSVASTHPYVMHALLAMSANHLAWLHSSNATRNLYLHHGSIALRGLHEAIGNFSHANADAVLAASLLLFWQATDWRSWSSLRAGIQSVIAAMQSWKHDSVFAEYVIEEDAPTNPFHTHRRRSSVSPVERSALLENAAYALQRLQLGLAGAQMELHWTTQLVHYVQQLQTLPSAQTPEEQFNHFYQLRKWLFWVPVLLLQREGGQGPAMLTIAHFYATALAIDPLFPDLGSSFCSAASLPPLEAIIAVTDAMHSERGADTSLLEVASLMQFPRQAAFEYRHRTLQVQQSALSQQPVSFGIDPSTLSYTNIGNLSPAFAPATPMYDVSQHTSPSGSSFLGVPTPYSFSSGTQQYGIPSPGFPPFTLQAQEHVYSFGGGFVPTAIWA
ncbi:hypothetical protein BAUCODRAFT_78015 [Baudoinia panamericana UAMH 10762]|uniref:Zn(2)-C6 fungal-type domain-containing protein n=1 Tax=Baudoinia panamericana (strain UAMH 10762) TaxID=717646 RepID=M2M7F7_BAUPA|nr:uncharacterized protein BAUCODRAFT_78015 [Baudoinia panamericana UAMH 10762]EMC92251.1 hypothetical protein BAUCODRAFT_78015 [Baudoinia panamericana UAMH 10762]